MIKFLHAADLHLDSPFASVGAEQARQYRQEQRQQLHKIFALAETEQVQLVFLAGDLFDSDRTYADTVECLMECCGECSAQIMIAPGNHDRLLPGSAYVCGQWPENVHIFKSNRVECVSLPELSVKVYGAGFCGKNEKALLEGFHAPDDGQMRFMVLHGDASDPNSPYDPVSQEQIAASNLTYLALGHIHTASGLQKAGETYYAWPGCTMGRGFDETGEKGVYLGTADDTGVQLTFRPLGARTYETVSADVSVGIETALKTVPEGCNLRLTLTGEADDIQIAEIKKRYENRYFSLEVRDATHPGRKLWEGLEEDSVRGIFLRDLKGRYDTATDAERKIITMAVRLGLDAMEGRELSQ